MSEAGELRRTEARIEELLAGLRSTGDVRVVRQVEELVRLLMQMYGAGLARVVALAAQTPGDPPLLDRLAADDLVGSLLVLHDLHPRDVTERIGRALDEVRPYLDAHAGGVDLLGVDEAGVVHLRLRGTCDGCPSSTVTVRNAIARAIEAAAPEVTGIDVAGLAPPGGADGLLHIAPAPPQPYPQCPVPEGEAG